MTVATQPSASYLSSMNLDGVTYYDKVEDLPEDPATLADDAYISGRVFAHLNDGMSVDSFRQMRARQAKAHRAGEARRPGDIPEPDEKIANFFVWKVSTFRTWYANKPGKGAGGGRRKGHKYAPAKLKPSSTLKLPHPCPHCSQRITPEDVQAQAQKEWEREQELEALKAQVAAQEREIRALREGEAIPEAVSAGVDEDRRPRELT